MYLPDIYFGKKIPTSLFLFGGNNLTICIPPEFCTMAYYTAEKFKWSPPEYGEVTPLNIEVFPWKILGLNHSTVKMLESDDSINVVSWSQEEFIGRSSYLDEGRSTPTQILKYQPIWIGTFEYKPGEGVIRTEIVLYTWAKLITSDGFTIDKCIHHLPSLIEWSEAFEEYKEFKTQLAQETIKISLPNFETLSLPEVLFIRSELKQFLSPFWRTISRIHLQYRQIYSTENDINYQEIEAITKDIVQAEFGGSIEAWENELSNEVSIKLNKKLTSIKKYGKILVNIISSIISSDLDKLSTTLFEIPSKAKTPNECRIQDFDKTIEFLFELKRINKNQ
jgi:hypothetical protein